MPLALRPCLEQCASFRLPFPKASCSFPLRSGGVLPGVHRVGLADRCRRFLLCRTVSSCTSSYPDRCAQAHRPLCLACMTAATGDSAPSNRRVGLAPAGFMGNGCRGGTTALAGPLPGLPGTELVLRVLSVMVGLSMYVFIINISVAFRGPRFNPSWHLTRRERRGCHRCIPCAGSLSLGRWMQADYEHPSK